MNNPKSAQRSRTYDAAISIAVHERPDVIVDQVLNIRRYFPNALIVLHINKAFNDSGSRFKLPALLSYLDNSPDIIVNPQHLETKWGDILHVILSNFRLVSDYSFKYFVILNSNELFIRDGAFEYISQYDAGMFRGYHTSFTRDEDATKKTVFLSSTIEDTALKGIMQEVGGDIIHLSQPEGLFFRKEIMLEMSDIIERHYNHALQNAVYPREETYFSTILCSPFFSKRNLKIGENISYRLGMYQNGWIVTPKGVKRFLVDTNGVFALKAFKRTARFSSRVLVRRCGKYEKKFREITGVKVWQSVAVLRFFEWIVLGLKHFRKR